MSNILIIISVFLFKVLGQIFPEIPVYLMLRYFSNSLLLQCCNVIAVFQSCFPNKIRNRIIIEEKIPVFCAWNYKTFVPSNDNNMS